MSFRFSIVFVVVVALLSGCTDPSASGEELLEMPSEPNEDAQPGGLFHDFLQDGKFDAAGHPQGAEVFEGEERCTPTTGVAGDVGIAAAAGADSSGTLCGAETSSLGDGTFTLNARASMFSDSAGVDVDDDREPVLEIAVFDEGDRVASRTMTAADFGETGVERDLAVTFVHSGDGSVTFEVNTTGAASVRLNYVEIFRATPRLVISPSSRVLDLESQPTFEIEMQDPPEDVSFEVACNDVDVTDVLTDLLDAGEAEWTDTEFRTLVEVPADRLFERCELPARVRVSAMEGGFPDETSRVTYLAGPVPCEFAPNAEDADALRILLSGFEPFPADSTRDNSSKEAVDAYVNGGLPEGLAVMKLVLPVEYDAAPGLLEDVISRCEPDVIIGFGQGRTEVDVETTAYNRKDTAAIAGGVPDNRGVVYGGAPILEGGPAERQTQLPVDSILLGLDGLGVQAGPSDDPGRYVCNNLFYRIMGIVSEDPGRTGGFVHLPRIPSVGDTEREMLRQTVSTVVEATVDAHF